MSSVSPEDGETSKAPVAADTGVAGRSDAIATLHTRGFIGRPGPTILLATFAGMLAMSLSFAVSPSILVSMAALIGGILVVYGFRTGEMSYTLTQEGLSRSFRPLAARYFALNRRAQTFRIDEIRSYVRDRDWSRYRAEEVESLKLSLRRWPYRIVITDMRGKDAFAAFADRFEWLAAGLTAEPAREVGQGQAAEERPVPEDAPDESGGLDARAVREGRAADAGPAADDGPAAVSRRPASPTTQPRRPARSSGPVIERRPGFYQSIWAKLLTAVFVVMAVALVVAWLAGLLSPTSVFRLLIVVIPGVIYMVWRSFGRRRD